MCVFFKLVGTEAWIVSGLCLSGLWMIYLPPKCLNYDNLSIKVRIMAADTWHFSFHSLPCRGTSSYLIRFVHGNLEMLFNCTVLLHSMPFCLVHPDVLFEASRWLGLGALIQICPLDQKLKSVFYYIKLLFEGLYTVNVTWRESNANCSLLSVFFQWYQS